MGSLALPNIDFSEENLKPGTMSWNDVRKQVMSALEEYGCFVASCDKLPLQLHDAIFSALEELFDLPTETKIQNKYSKPFFGYMGQIPFVPLYESMGIDYANSSDGIQAFTNVMWPNGNERFSKKVLSYTKLAAELEGIVVRMIFESYGVEKYHDSHLHSVSYLCRVIKYREAKLDETKFGLLPHTDKSFMSTIHQNQVNGLEIKAKDGKWFSVDLSPSDIVVMAGDAIMAWSNNRIKSPHHRVIMEGKETRYTITQFSFIEGIIETPEELVDDEHPLQFKPFHHFEFLNFLNKQENKRLECAIKSYCGV